MSYEIGTSSGYTDLLERLKDFISDPARIKGDHPNMDELVAIDDGIQTGESSQAWTIERWTDDRDSSGDGEIEMIANGPGSSGADEVYVGIDTYSDGGDDYYNWRMMGMTGFVSGADLEYQPGITQGRLPRMLMWRGSIPYWFFGNGRRYIVVAQISNIYEMLYQGFALPYGLPAQFPYPMVVGGSACPGSIAADHKYSSVALDHRGFPNPYGTDPGVIIQGTFDDTNAYRSTLKILQGTSWVRFDSKDGSTLHNNNNIWPYVCSESTIYGPANIFSLYLRENIDGSYPIFPLIMMMNNPVNHIFGELQGCYAVPGFGGIAPEDTFTVNGDTYIAFPIVANASRGDYCCIKKE